MSEEDNTVSITGGPMLPHEYVLVKAELSAGDERWIQNHAARSGGKGKEQALVWTIGDVKLATAQRMIKGWALSKEVTGINGEKERVTIPFDIHNIESLPGRTYRYILKKIDELNEDDDEEEDERFLGGAPATSEKSFKTEKIRRLKA